MTISDRVGDDDRGTHPRLIGVRIVDSPPIADVFVEMTPGLVVAYGRNGAGKTRMLDGIRESLSGGRGQGRRS